MQIIKWIAQFSVLSLKGAWGVFWNTIYDPSDLKCSCDSEAQVWEYFGWKTQTLESLFEFHPLEQRRANCIGNQPKEFYIIIWCLKQPDIRNGWHLATNDHDIALSIFVNCTIPMWTWNESQIVPDMVQLMCWYLEDISWYIWERSDAARKCFLPNIHCIFIIHHVNNTILTS